MTRPSRQRRAGPADHREAARQAVAAPATNLLAVAVISCLFLLPSVSYDTYLLATGQAARAFGDGLDPELVVQIRAFWGAAILITSGYVAFGAWQMRNLRKYSHARRAALVAMIPCLGPCCFAGIPIGWWCQRVLAREEIQAAFEKQ